MTRVIAFANQKGGVGKTTTTHNIGFALASMDKKVLLVDLDPQNSLTSLCLSSSQIQNLGKTLSEILFRGISVRESIVNISSGVDIVPSNKDLALVEKMLGVAKDVPVEIIKYVFSEVVESGDYDYILIDCPPQLSQLTLNALTMATEVIIPTQAEYLSTKGLERLKDTIENIKQISNKTLEYKGVIITRYRKNTLHNQEIKDFLDTSENVLGVVSESIRVSDSAYEDLPIVLSHSQHQSAMDYMSIAEKIKNLF